MASLYQYFLEENTYLLSYLLYGERNEKSFLINKCIVFHDLFLAPFDMLHSIKQMT